MNMLTKPEFLSLNTVSFQLPPSHPQKSASANWQFGLVVLRVGVLFTRYKNQEVHQSKPPIQPIEDNLKNRQPPATTTHMRGSRHRAWRTSSQRR